MSPVNPHVVNQLRQLIYYHLDCNLLRNALFLAGRLHAYEPRASEAGYLLGLCHLRLGQIKAAYDASKQSGSRGTHLGCSYVYAQACLGLERYMEGITALDRSRGLWAARNSWSASRAPTCVGCENMANVIAFKTNTATLGDNIYQMLRQYYVSKASFGRLTKIRIRRSTAMRRRSSLTRSCGMHLLVFAISVCGLRQIDYTVANVVQVSTFGYRTSSR